jgi:hypothetical protein
VGVAEEAEVGG